MILDARFDYEHEGGHIIGAHNVYLPTHVEDLKDQFANMRMGDRLCVVIHCEFSSQRGPKLFRELRAWDREMNVYPNLHFPEMYILQGGYKEFYNNFPEWCTRGYVPMHHRDFSDQCTAAMRLTRSQSSTKIKRIARSDAEAASPLFGVRADSFTSQAAACGSSSSASACSANRVVFSSNGKQESVLTLSMSSIPSLSQSSSSSATIDNGGGSDTEGEDEDLCAYEHPASPAALRIRSQQPMWGRNNTNNSGQHPSDILISRVSAPTRSITFHHIPIHRHFTQSTSDLPRWPEDDEENSIRPCTSRS